MHKTLTFQSIAEQFKNKTEYEKFMNECQNTYELKVYRVNTMTKQQAINYYHDLKNKYDNGIYQRLPTSWYQNERRLFIWLLISYIKFSGIKSLDNQDNWESLSEIFFGKDHRLLRYQYMNILKKTGRVNWTAEQDQIILQAYNKYQKGQWNQIAKQLYFSGKSAQFKSPKHCRERWNNHLNTEIKKDPWNDEEDLQLLTLVKQKGKKWSQIAKQINHKRTQHQIKNRFNSLINHAEKKETQQETLNNLISSYQKKKENSKFTFFNNIIVVKEQQKPSAPIILKRSFDQNDEKRQHVTSGGMSIIYCGNKNQGIDRNLTAAIQDKLFGSTSLFLSDVRSDNFWLDKPIVHTPGHHFFQDSCNYEKKLGDFQFKLSQKGSIQKSQFAASMQFLKLPRSDISQQYKILSSSVSDLRSGTNCQFSSQIKEL